MLFYIKELVASAEDPALMQNPFVLTKIDLNCVRSFDFEDFLRSVIERKTGEVVKPTEIPRFENDSAGEMNQTIGVASLTGSQESLAIGDMLEKGDFTDDLDGISSDDEDPEFSRKKDMAERKKASLYPKLRGRTMRPDIPSMLTIMCNMVEVMRLRNILVSILHQREVLQSVFAS